MAIWSSNARALLALVAVAVVWTFALGLAALTRSSAVAVGATIDITLTSAIALYLIAVRGGHLPSWVVGATVAIGLAVAKSRFGDIASAVFAIAIGLELAMAAWLVVRGRRAIRAWRAARAAGAPAIDAFEGALRAVGLPARVVSIAVTEFAVLGSLATGWRRPRRSADRFTAHRENGWAMLVGAFVVLGLGELVLAHLLLVAFTSSAIAWTVSALSAYSLLWLVGDVLALRHGGVVIGERALELALGIRCRGAIPWSSIVSITRARAPAGSLDLSIGGANTVVQLRQPSVFHVLFGRRREASVIALSVDDAARFVEAASRKLAVR